MDRYDITGKMGRGNQVFAKAVKCDTGQYMLYADYIAERKKDLMTDHLQSSVLTEVLWERKRQDEKWGVQNHEPEKWLTILGEEFGEVCRALCENLYKEGSNPQYRHELIHVAAVAVAMVECYDRKFMEKSDRNTTKAN